MKTFEEFENALVNGERVYIGNGKGLVVNFYPCMRSAVCGLITACVEFSVKLEDNTFHNSSSVVSSMEAYQTYESLSNMA